MKVFKKVIIFFLFVIMGILLGIGLTFWIGGSDLRSTLFFVGMGMVLVGIMLFQKNISSFSGGTVPSKSKYTMNTNNINSLLEANRLQTKTLDRNGYLYSKNPFKVTMKLALIISGLILVGVHLLAYSNEFLIRIFS